MNGLELHVIFLFGFVGIFSIGIYESDICFWGRQIQRIHWWYRFCLLGKFATVLFCDVVAFCDVFVVCGGFDSGPWAHMSSYGEPGVTANGPPCLSNCLVFFCCFKTYQNW